MGYCCQSSCPRLHSSIAYYELNNEHPREKIIQFIMKIQLDRDGDGGDKASPRSGLAADDTLLDDVVSYFTGPIFKLVK